MAAVAETSDYIRAVYKKNSFSQYHTAQILTISESVVTEDSGTEAFNITRNLGRSATMQIQFAYKIGALGMERLKYMIPSHPHYAVLGCIRMDHFLGYPLVLHSCKDSWLNLGSKRFTW